MRISLGVEGNGRHTGARKLVCAPAGSIIKTMISGLASTRDLSLALPTARQHEHEHKHTHTHARNDSGIDMCITV